MGYYCWVCGRVGANEKFSGKGHNQHICKTCMRKPREEREQVRALLDIEGFLNQRNISAKNISRPKSLCKSPDQGVREKAELVLEVARLKPHKRKRVGYLARRKPELLGQLARHGLLLDDPRFPMTALSMGDGD